MTDPSVTPSSGPPESQPSVGEDPDSLLGQLRRKQGSWVDWAKACQQLQKLRYTPQQIFEQSGFEPIQQNQIIVGMQVYEGILKVGVSEAVQKHFGHRGSDILYEFRILSQTDRPLAAELALAKQMDADDAHELARAVKLFAQLRTIPTGFTPHPGDAMAYQAWRSAQQTSDLQDRSRLIARALKFVHSDSARQEVEKLLMDFSAHQNGLLPFCPSIVWKQRITCPASSQW